MLKRVGIILIIIFISFGLIYALLRNLYHLDQDTSLVTKDFPPKEGSKVPQGFDYDKKLSIPQGFRLAVFANLKDVGSPRVLAFDPNGIIVVSIPSEGKVLAFPDRDRNGMVDEFVVVIDKLNKPHGITFHGENFFVAETDKVVKFTFNTQDLKAEDPKILFSLPAGGRHFTRTIKVFDDKLYTSVGSSCDVCIENDWHRSSVLVSDLDGKNLRVYAEGLRNTVFFTFDEKGRMWGNDMGRDFLGDDLPPDELNIIEEGKDYGWPNCYGKNVHDKDFDKKLYPPRVSVCEALEKTLSTFDYPSHVAPLGLVFINSPLFSKQDQGDLLSALHGSWNRSVPTGYKIVKLEMQDDSTIGMSDYITGWLKGEDVLGRPVDLVFDKDGVLFISDDKANLIYILTKEE